MISCNANRWINLFRYLVGFTILALSQSTLVGEAAESAENQPPQFFLPYPLQSMFGIDAETFDAVREAEYDGAERACAGKVDAHIDGYVRRYRAYAPFRDDPDWRAAWLERFALTTLREELGCHFIVPLRRTLERAERARFHSEDDSGMPVWCGRWSDDTVDASLKAAIAGLVPLAFDHGMPSAEIIFTSRTASANETGRYATIHMNPDVALYLVERVVLLAAPEFGVHPTQFADAEGRARLRLDAVSPERRAEVMAAVETGDYQSILDTTEPCQPREDFPPSIDAQ